MKYNAKKPQPCPWCDCNDEGSLRVNEATDLSFNEVIDVPFGDFYVWCCNCAVAGPRADSEEEAWRLWDNREALIGEED